MIQEHGLLNTSNLVAEKLPKKQKIGRYTMMVVETAFLACMFLVMKKQPAEFDAFRGPCSCIM